MSATSEAECGALFINARKVLSAKIKLEELKWKQSPTPICANNNTTGGITKNHIRRNKMETTANTNMYQQ